MKKVLMVMAAAAAVLSLAACAGNANSSSSSQNDSAQTSEQQETMLGTSGFTEEDGVLTYLDTERSPFDGAGLKITVDKPAKTVKFVKTGLDGSETVEYYNFDFNSNTVEQYYYVSMMGTGFYYTFDLDAGEIVKVEDSDRNDSTQSAKDNGRYDSANERMKSDVEALQNYFTKQYGVEISDMVND